MCDNIKTIARVKSGELIVYKKCNKYNLNFNNLSFVFSKKEFESFRNYINEIDIDYWECSNTFLTMNQRRIPIPSLQMNLYLMFNRQEIEELKVLVGIHKKNKLLRIQDIDYTLIKN